MYIKYKHILNSLKSDVTSDVKSDTNDIINNLYSLLLDGFNNILPTLLTKTIKLKNLVKVYVNQSYKIGHAGFDLRIKEIDNLNIDVKGIYIDSPNKDENTFVLNILTDINLDIVGPVNLWLSSSSEFKGNARINIDGYTYSTILLKVSDDCDKITSQSIDFKRVVFNVRKVDLGIPNISNDFISILVKKLTNLSSIQNIIKDKATNPLQNALLKLIPHIKINKLMCGLIWLLPQHITPLYAWS